MAVWSQHPLPYTCRPERPRDPSQGQLAIQGHNTIQWLGYHPARKFSRREGCWDQGYRGRNQGQLGCPSQELLVRDRGQGWGCLEQCKGLDLWQVYTPLIRQYRISLTLRSWTDSQLKAFADKHGIPVPQPRKRDTLLSSLRSGYETVATKAGETTSYPGNWLYSTWSESGMAPIHITVKHR